MLDTSTLSISERETKEEYFDYTYVSLMTEIYLRNSYKELPKLGHCDPLVRGARSPIHYIKNLSHSLLPIVLKKGIKREPPMLRNLHDN